MMDYKIEHIGYLTEDIVSTAKTFSAFGYSAEATVNDDTQKTRICFLRKQGEVPIELVEPYEENKTMNKMLKKGVSPYHTCFCVSDINSAFDELSNLGFTPLFLPVEAPAFNNRLICYFWKSDIGLIELVNEH